MAKNLLQEWCHNLTRTTGQPHPLPVYKTDRVGGTDHIPSYVSTVTCGAMVVVGGPHSNKKAAEADAAEKAYHSVTTRKTPLPVGGNRAAPIVVAPLSDTPARHISIPTGKPKHTVVHAKPHSVILIDGESFPRIVNQFRKYTVGFTIYLFLSQPQVTPASDSVITVVSPTPRKGSVATTMSVMVGHLLERSLFSHYCIVTRSDFGATLVDLITATGAPQNARVITALNQL